MRSLKGCEMTNGFLGFDQRNVQNPGNTRPVAKGAGDNIGNPLRIIRKGESLEFQFDRGDRPIDGWVCELQVRQFPDSTAEITRTIPLDDNMVWSGTLTSTETAALSGSGIYRMVGVLTNATTGEQEQVVIRFQLGSTWAT